MESSESKWRGRHGLTGSDLGRAADRYGERLNILEGSCDSPEPGECRPPNVSGTQSLVWRSSGASCGSHLVGAWVLSGPLDRDALRSALEWLMKRHNILSTTFQEQGGVLTANVTPLPAS